MESWASTACGGGSPVVLPPVLTPDGRRGVPSPKPRPPPVCRGNQRRGMHLAPTAGETWAFHRLCPILEGPQISHVTQRGPVTPTHTLFLFKMTGSRKDRVQASVCERVCPCPPALM